MTEEEAILAYDGLSSFKAKKDLWMRKRAEVRFFWVFKVKYTSEYRGGDKWKHFIDVEFMNRRIVGITASTGREDCKYNDNLPYVTCHKRGSYRYEPDGWRVDTDIKVRKIIKEYQDKRIKTSVEADIDLTI